MEIFTDNPISSLGEDEFGFLSYGRILAGVICETQRLPFCIGIFGEWGSGKSSLMNIIKEYLKGYQRIKTIWFNPWKYDKKEDLWSALIQTILYEIIENSEGINKERAVALAKLTLGRVIPSMAASLLTTNSLEKLERFLSEQDEIYHKHINSFEENFEKVVKAYIREEGRLVIFVDDLDRCLPENAITILESMKLFIGHAKCVFVLAMDQYIIEQGIELRFGQKIKLSGRDYLDKMIQVPFFLPPVPFEKLRAAFQEISKRHFYNEEIWKLIKLGLDGNPRRTKRFINCFCLLQQVLSSEFLSYHSQDVRELNQDEQNWYLAKLLIIQMVFPDFYSHLRSNCDSWQYIDSKLVKARDLQSQQDALQERKFIRLFWENEKFRSFMERTFSELYTSPDAMVVESMLLAITLVGEDRRT